ncbi:MAG: hypothetical protein ACFFDN_52090 [Candidatus Hodarchaeota archaeon]
MKNKDDYFYTGHSNNNLKPIFWIIFGIIGFIAVYLPLFGQNLRYQTGTFFGSLFNIIGSTFITIGIILMLWGIFTIVCGKAFGGIKLLILGVLLIYIGGFFVAPALFGVSSSGKEISEGYH